MIGRILRDPLAHFLVAGAAIWAVVSLTGGAVDPSDRAIVLTRDQQASLALAFERTMGRAPTDAELDAAIAQWVREEVLYREAIRLGLDENDPVVRRRLAAKMDELAAAEAELARPRDAALREFYSDHGTDYESGGRLDFEQLWFSSEQAALLARDEATPRGGETGLPQTLSGAGADDIERQFGGQFSDALMRLSVSPEWQGPVASGYGWHLVRLSRREEGSVPPLEEVREAVERDWRSRTMQARREKAYQLLRDAYRIEIE